MLSSCPPEEGPDPANGALFFGGCYPKETAEPIRLSSSYVRAGSMSTAMCCHLPWRNRITDRNEQHFRNEQKEDSDQRRDAEADPRGDAHALPRALDDRTRRHVGRFRNRRQGRESGSTLYVNVGSEAGVKEGDDFTVIRAGEVIKDPDTGEVLGANETTVGRVRITAVMGPRLSKAAPVSGAVFKVGDVLKN